MTDRTDDTIERLAADWLRAKGPHDAPESLRLRLHEIVAARPVARRRPPLLLLAASFAALLALSAAAVGLGGLLLDQHAPTPSTAPSPLPAVSPSPSATVSVSPAPTADALATIPSIQFAGLVDANHGSVVGRDTFFATDDGGATWTTTALPGPHVGNGVLGATFADADHGWLATLDSEDLSSRVFDIWRTIDGGRTWQKATLHEGAVFSDTMGQADFSVVGEGHLFVWIRGGMPSGWTSDLYESTDGGATWSGPRSSPEGVAGPASFADAAHGVVAGGASGHDLFVTSDGGSSWHAVDYPLPKGADRSLTTFLGPPRFLDSDHGALAAIYSTPDLLPMLTILSTMDGGATWSIATTDPANQGPVAFVDATHWLEVTGGIVRETTDAGAAWSERAMAPVPGAIGFLSMADPTNGWAIVDGAGCASTDCVDRALVGTTDGWRTNRTLTPANETSQPSPSASASQTTSAAEIAAAARAVDSHIRDLVNGDYAAAWSFLAPAAQAQRGSLADFIDERRAFFASVRGKYVVTPNPTDVAPIGDWIAGTGAPIDLRHAVLVEVTYPALAGSNAGGELYVVVPGDGPNGLVLYPVR
jgi:photosystem II stability/assembly factor-like uncharacterized protein